MCNWVPELEGRTSWNVLRTDVCKILETVFFFLIRLSWLVIFDVTARTEELSPQSAGGGSYGAIVTVEGQGSEDSGLWAAYDLAISFESSSSSWWSLIIYNLGSHFVRHSFLRHWGQTRVTSKMTNWLSWKKNKKKPVSRILQMSVC